MNFQGHHIFLVDGLRTPIGSFNGCLSNFSAVELGATVTKGLLQRNNLPPEEINELYWGNVCSANLGQSTARQVALNSGLSIHTPCTTINKACSSSLKTISLAGCSIALNPDQIMIAGGSENMSQVPHYLTKLRKGKPLGNKQLIDGLLRDGLTDAFTQSSMGELAEQLAKKHSISREEQDEWAKISYQKAQAAQNVNLFTKEIISLQHQDKKGNLMVIEKDEEIAKGKIEKASLLKPAFSKDGTITPFNASKINDGAAGVILTSEKKANQLNLKTRAKLISYADYAHEPEWFTTAPIPATKKVLEKANLSLKDIDFFEINEAFAVVVLAWQKELKVPFEKINIKGGAIALGHPIGTSGCRIVVSLLNILEQKKGKYGLAVICNGGGGSSALIIENLNQG